MIAKKSQDLVALREQIALVKAEAAAVATAPLVLEEAEANLADTVDRLAQLYMPGDLLLEFGRDPAPRIDSVQQLVGDPRYDLQHFAAFLVATFRDPLLDAWRARLRAQYLGDPGLVQAAVPLSERAARLEVLRRRLRELEVAEERAIVQAELRGESVDRREDVSPSILFAPEVLAEETAA